MRGRKISKEDWPIVLVRSKPTASGRATLRAMPTRGEFVNRVWAQESHRLARWIVRLVATKTASILTECHRLVRWIVTLPSYEPETPPVEPVGSFRRLRMLYLATSVTLHGTRPWHLGNHVRPCAWPRRGLPMRASPPFLGGRPKPRPLAVVAYFDCFTFGAIVTCCPTWLLHA